MIYHDYILFSIKPHFAELPQAKQTQYKKEFLQKLQDTKNVVTDCYATVGLKADSNMLIWFQSDTIENLQDFVNELLHTKLGTCLQIKHTLLGMTRPTQYSPDSKSHVNTNRKGKKYLIIYPFTKTKEWYMLTFEERKQLMRGHITIGMTYPQITQLLLYSYGVDDSEFIVSYEADDLTEFQSLVMDLRSDKVRMYTLTDTPIITCIYKTHEEVLNYL